MKEQLIEKILEKYLLWEDLKEEVKNPYIWEYVLVRWYDAGVWFGKLKQANKWSIILEEARMLWRWWCKESIWMSWLASYWLADRNEVKILPEQKEVLITDERVSTFFKCSDDVVKQIKEYKVAKQE